MVSQRFGFYTVKMTAIFVMSVIYFVLGSFLSVLLNEALPDEDLHQLSTPYLVAQLSVIFGMIGVVYYVLRNIVKSMPFFLDGMYGFQYGLLREATGGIIVAYTMYAYLDRLQLLMTELHNRFRSSIVSFRRNFSSNILTNA